MSGDTATAAKIAVGVIVQRRKANSPWVDFTWKPVSVLVGVPDAVRAEVEDFIGRHHVERPFYKRKRDRADPEALARQKPLGKESG